MPLSSRIRALGLRQEVVEGTFEPLQPGDANLQIYETKFNASVGRFQRNPLRANLSKLSPVIGIKRVTVTGKCEIRGPDDVGANLGIPEVDVVLKACGYKRTDTYVITTIDDLVEVAEDVLPVASTVGFLPGNVVVIGRGTAREESGVIATVQAGASLTLTAGVIYEHTAVQADVVENLDNVTARAYSPTSSGTGATTTASAGTAGTRIVSVLSTVGFSAGNSIRIDPGQDELNTRVAAVINATTLHITDPLPLEILSAQTVQNLDSPVGYSASGQIEEQGRVKKFRGARGNGNWTGKVGEPGFFDFSLDGGIHEVVDAAQTFTPTIGTKVPPAFLSAELTLAGTYTDSCITEFSMGTNNTLAPRECANSSTGLKSTLITDRAPGGSFDPESELEAVYPAWAKFLAGTPASLSMRIGTVSRNRVTITAPAITYVELADNDRNNIAVDGVAFECATLTGTGDDEIVITYD